MRMRSSLICLKSPNVSILLDLIQFRLNSSQQSFHTQWKAPLCLHEDRRCSHTEEDAITMQRKDKLGWRRKWRASPDFQSNSIDRINFLLISKVSPARVPSRVETAGGKSLCSSSWVKTLRLLFPDTSATHVIGGLLVTPASVLLVLLTTSWHTQEHITNAPSVAKGGGGREGLGEGFWKERLALCVSSQHIDELLSARGFCCCVREMEELSLSSSDDEQNHSDSFHHQRWTNSKNNIKVRSYRNQSREWKQRNTKVTWSDGIFIIWSSVPSVAAASVTVIHLYCQVLRSRVWWLLSTARCAVACDAFTGKRWPRLHRRETHEGRWLVWSVWVGNCCYFQLQTENDLNQSGVKQ